jgi:hypothetical protein
MVMCSVEDGDEGAAGKDSDRENGTTVLPAMTYPALAYVLIDATIAGRR